MAVYTSKWLTLFQLFTIIHHSHGYTLPEQQHLLSEMINDLREAYNEQLHSLNKRVAELEGTVADMKAEELTRDRRLEPHTTATPRGPKVAFYAQLSHDLASVGDHQTIVFDTVVTNVGGAYNKNNGMFTAPADDTYAFSWTTFNNLHSHMQTELFVNNELKGRTWSDAMDHEDSAIASNTVVVELNASDVVWIASNTVSSQILHGRLMTTFSGWCVFN